MVDFSNREDVERWLKDQPSEVAVVFAARAALRVFPTAVTLLRTRPGVSPNRKVVGLLPILRALSLAWIEAKYGPGSELIKTSADAAIGAPFPNIVPSLAALAAVRVCRDRATAHLIYDAVDAISSTFAAAKAMQVDPRAIQDAWAADARVLDQGIVAKRLAASKLWLSVQPEKFKSLWRELEVGMFAEHPDWVVWTNWYRARLSGSWSTKALEIARATIRQEIWLDGPRAVNAEIKRLIDEYKRSKSPSPPIAVPAQKPAAVETLWNKGRLTVPKTPAKSNLSNKKIEAAFSALRAELRELADDVNAEGNIDKRPATFLSRLADRIPPKAPQQDELFRIGHVEAIFGSYAKTVEQEWPNFLVARFHAVSLQFDRTLRQSPLWRDFKRNAEKETLTADQIGASQSLANETASALRQNEAVAFVDKQVPQALDQLADALANMTTNKGSALGAVEAGSELLAVDLVESVNNTLKPIAEVALTAASDYVEGFGKGLKKAAKKQGPIDGEKAFKWLRRLVVGGATGAGSFVALSNLIAKFPEAFGWLERILHMLK